MEAANIPDTEIINSRGFPARRLVHTFPLAISRYYLADKRSILIVSSLRLLAIAEAYGNSDVTCKKLYYIVQF